MKRDAGTRESPWVGADVASYSRMNAEMKGHELAPGELETLVARHDVHWEVWPRNHSTSDGMRPVGFDLELYGTHDEPSRYPSPGCDECVDVYESLRRIARAIMPAPDRESRYELAVFDQALHYAEKLDMRAEVRITISILHKEDYGHPVDSCEVTCLHDMEMRLRSLGARKGQGRT